MINKKEIEQYLANWEEQKKRVIEDPVLEKRIRDLYLKYAKDIAGILGAAWVPPLDVKILENSPVPAITEGHTIFANKKYFSERRDDGALIHEFAHVVMYVLNAEDNVNWLEEGIADFVRDKLGFQTFWSFAHYEKGRALAGYQTSAHFLMYLERLQPGTIVDLLRELKWATYNEFIFRELFDKSLSELIREYESAYDKK